MDGEERRPTARLRAAVPAPESPEAGQPPPPEAADPAPTDDQPGPPTSDQPGPPTSDQPGPPLGAPSTIDLDAQPAPRPDGGRPLTRVLRRVPSPRRVIAGASSGVADFAQRPSGRVALPGLLLLSLIAITGAAGAYLVSDPGAHRARTGSPADATRPAAAGDSTTAAPEAGQPLAPSLDVTTPSTGTVPGDTIVVRPADALATWAQGVSNKIDVPPVAVQAYGYAELVLAQTRPGCRLSWTTLAAIGKVESNHGRASSASLLTDGRALPAIIGPTLNGTGGNKNIRDTDIGALDGDRVYDHAVGPMQFLPSTWRQHAVDADNDGVRDPNDIDDAALSAAYYLCGTARDLSTARDWWVAILAYNNVQVYARDVFTAANDYGTRSRT
jgi:Transglycosylase SLT domain